MSDSGSGEKQGKPASFEELALPHFVSLYRFAHWLTRNREDAEDLVQETFAKALRGFPSFQPGTSFKAWIFRIQKNAFLNSRTGLREQRNVPLDPEAEATTADPAAASPETLLLDHAQRTLVRGAIEGLPPHLKEPVVLRDVEGLTYQEIAEALGIPIGTVMSRLSRGREAIRKSVAGSGGGRR